MRCLALEVLPLAGTILVTRSGSSAGSDTMMPLNSGNPAKKPKASGVVIAVLLVALVASNIWWALSGQDVCDRFLYHEEVSPNGKFGVFLLYNNCGATTPFTTQAVLLPAGRGFPRSGYEPFLVVKDLHDLQVHWHTDTAVEIALPKDETVYRRDAKVNGLTIIYH